MQRTLVIAVILVATAACETQSNYATCQLDEEVTSKQVCDGTGGTEQSTGTTTSCVVTAHPHCVESICLSFFNRRAVCSKVCSQDADCPNGMCWEYSEKANSRFCVPKDQFCAVNKADARCSL